MRWVLGEALRDVASGTTHVLRLALVLALVVGAATVADVAAVDALLDRGATFRDSGASVLTIEAPGAVDGATCDALAAIPGVRAAGALRQEHDPLVPAALPRGPVAHYAVTPGTVSLLRVEGTAPAGVLLAQEAATALGVDPGDPVVLGDVATAVRGTYAWPDDGRRSGYGYAALVPGKRAEPYDSCWVDAWPAPAGLAGLARLALLPGSDADAGPAMTSQLNTTLGTTFDGARLHAQRTTRHAPWVTLAAGALLGFTATRARRLELAAARHVGVTAPAQHVQLLLESLAWVLPAGVLLTAGATVQIALGSGVEPGALVAAAASAALPGLLGALLGCQAGVATTREAHLFRYFRQR